MGLYVKVRKLLIGTGIGKIPFVTQINEILLSLLKKNEAVVFGRLMRLDEHDGLELSLNGVYEPTETKLIMATVKPGQVVLDIGAHIGYYTLILSDIVGKDGWVFAFEPDKKNFEILKKNVEINGCKNVTLVNAAVTSRTGKITLYDGGGKSSNPTIGDNGNPGTTEVDCVSLDSYFQFLPHVIDFIKMDIEGAEVYALAGMTNLLMRKNNKKIKMILEFYPFGLSRSGVSGEKLLGVLAMHGFRMSIIDEDKETIYPISVKEILSEYTAEKKNVTNLLCERDGTA